MHFFEKNGFLTLKIASNRKVVKKLFVWGIITYLFVKKKLEHFGGKNVKPIFLF